MDHAGGDHHEPHHEFLHKKTEVRIVVGITCGLSVIGSLLIILSYLCFRGLRSRARQILVNISIMDFGVATANLIGLSVRYDQYYERPNCLPDGIHADPHICPVSDTIHDLCVSQAFLSAYFTYGSIMWTISLSFYLYFLIVHHGTNQSKYSLYFSYIFCYLMPLFLTLWFLKTGRLGYAPYNSAGWCSDIMNNPKTGKRDIYATILGYDLWIYLTFLLVPILSISVHLYIRQELKKSNAFYKSDRFKQALHSVDYKFLLIPVAFVILRIWSCILVIIFIYVGKRFDQVPETVGSLLLNLSGIGDSGQGIANAILFVLFTKNVRDKFTSCFKKKSAPSYPWEKQPLLNGPSPKMRATPSMERTPPVADY